ncbi:MAG: DUF3783 domain-containing protein [Eubacterium sp.]|nr:DUF3783 domain-containing protein [Eubacterium sp.]
MKELLLLVETDDRLKSSILKAALPLHIHAKTIFPEEYGLTLGQILEGGTADRGVKKKEGSASCQDEQTGTSDKEGMSASPNQRIDTSGEEGLSACSSQDGLLGEPMIVMCGFSSVRMNLLLNAMRKYGAIVPLKAMLTPTNQNWTVAELFRQISEEHAAMTKAAGKGSSK